MYPSSSITHLFILLLLLLQGREGLGILSLEMNQSVRAKVISVLYYIMPTYMVHYVSVLSLMSVQRVPCPVSLVNHTFSSSWVFL